MAKHRPLGLRLISGGGTHEALQGRSREAGRVDSLRVPEVRGRPLLRRNEAEQDSLLRGFLALW